MKDQARENRDGSRWRESSVVYGSELRFRRLLEKLPAGAYTCDPDGLITYYNQHALQLWGRAPKLHDPVDRFCGSFKLFSSDGAPIAHEECWMALAIRTEKEFNGHEIVIERPDGKRLTVLAHANPIRDEAGRLLGAVNVLVDITDRRNAEEVLKNSDRRKDEFLATLSHELRTPLASITTAVELLNVRGDDSDVGRSARDIIQRQVERLTRLVDELLDVSRITSGKIKLRRETIEVQAMARRALESLRPSAEARRLQLDARLHEEPLFVDGDAIRLEQLLGNLIHNALKYTDPGGHIWLTVEPSADHVELRVRDDGIGIAADVLPRIFGLFEQSPRAIDRCEGGLGIGLTLVRTLAVLHGGTVEGRSDGPGKGAEFIVRLPLAANPVRASAALLDVSAATGEATPSRARVVVAEDDPDLASGLRSLLESWNHEVRVVHDGQAAVAAILENPTDVALLDIGLPGADGYAAAAAVRLGGYKGQLIALTGLWTRSRPSQSLRGRIRRPHDEAHRRRGVARASGAGDPNLKTGSPEPPGGSQPRGTTRHRSCSPHTGGISMKNVQHLALLFALSVAGTAAVGACRTTQSAGKQIDDAAIKVAVKAKLAKDVRFSTLTNIEVNSTNGIVTLAGQVKNERDLIAAAELARTVDGVVKVNNELQVEKK